MVEITFKKKIHFNLSLKKKSSVDWGGGGLNTLLSISCLVRGRLVYI